jgi:hypothetical protein
MPEVVTADAGTGTKLVLSSMTMYVDQSPFISTTREHGSAVVINRLIVAAASSCKGCDRGGGGAQSFRQDIAG